MNAEVTMPIIELDKLRKTIENQEAIIEEYKKNEKSVLLKVSSSYYTSELQHSFGHTPAFYKSVEKTVIEPPQYIGFEEVKEELKREDESKVIQDLGTKNRRIISLEKEIQNNKTEYQRNIDTLTHTHKIDLENREKIYNENSLKYENEIKKLKGELVDIGKDEKIDMLNRQIKGLIAEVEQLNNRTFFQRLFNL